LGKCCFNLAASFIKHFLLPRRDFKALYGDSWMVITVASDGLGKDYAIQLAKVGFKVVLIARN